MTQRVLVVGNIGTGKTVLTHRFGLNITREAEKKGINLAYVHVNCRECKGSSFMILQRVILKFIPRFPRRGYSAEELLHTLMEVLDEKDVHLILCLDELEALVRSEGSDPLYSLTRVQEERLGAPQRLSLICILRETQCLETLDSSTKSTLQRNLIRLEKYSKPQLQDILNDRVNLAFRDGTVSPQIVGLIAELGSTERGDARYAIELLWRAGKYADASDMKEVFPECVRKAAASVYPVIGKNVIAPLSLHERLFLLGIARHFKQAETAYMTMGEAEDAYAMVCEEYGKKQRGHTQLWKYAKELAALGIINTELSGAGQRGKTTHISLPKVPASDLEEELSKVLYAKRR